MVLSWTLLLVVLTVIIGTCSSLKCYKCKGDGKCATLDCPRDTNFTDNPARFSCIKVAKHNRNEGKFCLPYYILNRLNNSKEDKCGSDNGGHIYHTVVPYWKRHPIHPEERVESEDGKDLEEEDILPSDDVTAGTRSISLDESYVVCSCTTDFCNDGIVLYSHSGLVLGGVLVILLRCQHLQRGS